MKEAAITFFLSFFFLLWSFWSSSLKLIINNEMVVFFFNVEGCNGYRKETEKGGDDLEI